MPVRQHDTMINCQLYLAIVQSMSHVRLKWMLHVEHYGNVLSLCHVIKLVHPCISGANHFYSHSRTSWQVMDRRTPGKMKHEIKHILFFNSPEFIQFTSFQMTRAGTQTCYIAYIIAIQCSIKTKIESFYCIYIHSSRDVLRYDTCLCWFTLLLQSIRMIRGIYGLLTNERDWMSWFCSVWAMQCVLDVRFSMSNIWFRLIFLCVLFSTMGFEHVWKTFIE